MWARLLERAGLPATKALEEFDRVVETRPDDPATDMIEDTPVGFGRPIGERHAPRWIKRVPKTPVANNSTST